MENGASVHYVDEEAGPTLLLLHGNPTWSFLYRKLIRGLKDYFRCVALDYPGFGLSSAPDRYTFTPREHSLIVEEFVDRLNLSKLTIMVQDWGGPIGFSLAIRRPELVDRFIVGNTWAWPLTDPPRVAKFSQIMGGPVGRLAAFWFNGVVRFFMRQGAKPAHLLLSTRCIWNRFENAALAHPRTSSPASSYTLNGFSPKSNGFSRPSLIIQRLSFGG